MILNFKNDDGYEIIINMNHVMYIVVSSQGGHSIAFAGGGFMKLSWKEYDRLLKALEAHGE